MRPLPDRLLLVVEPDFALSGQVERLAAAGARWFWLRAKGLAPDAAGRLVQRLSGPIAQAGGVLSLGVQAETAAALEASAVQLPGNGDIVRARSLLGNKALIGISAHGLEQIAAAGPAGADYATFSPIFPSPGKPGYGPVAGLAGLGASVALDFPIVALGGITPARARSCLGAGAAAVAVLGGIAAAEDPVAALRLFRAAIDI